MNEACHVWWCVWQRLCFFKNLGQEPGAMKKSGPQELHYYESALETWVDCCGPRRAEGGVRRAGRGRGRAPLAAALQ